MMRAEQPEPVSPRSDALDRPGDGAGDDELDFDSLLPAVYEELRQIASAVIRRRQIVSSTRTSSLINDVYIRLAGRKLKFRGRLHFLRLAARAMRRVLIDQARRATAEKRGGGRPAADFPDDIVPAFEAPQLLLVEEALSRLAEFDARKGRIVELRFFGGLTVEETAAALDISVATVKREWTIARAWLSRQIQSSWNGNE